MKRFLPLTLLILLLCGCSAKETAAPTTIATVPTEPVIRDTYVSGSQIETATEGAIRQYKLDTAAAWIKTFNSGVLVAGEGDQTVLTLISGENGTVSAQITLSAKLAPTDCQIVPNGLAYYDSSAKQVVFLDTELKETARLQLPADISGSPAIAPDGTEIYYCVGETISAMDTANKIVRPVRTNTCKQQTLLGCYLDSAVVACQVEDAEGAWSTLYISGADGQLLYKDAGIETIDANLDSYFVQRKDGIVEQYIYEKIAESSKPVQMNIAENSVFAALDLGGVIGQQQIEEATVLSLYNPQKTVTVSLPKEQKVIQAAANSAEVWLLDEAGTLLRWELQKSTVEGDADYSGPVYTAAAPDTAGIKVCTKRADEIGKKHSVSIRIWDRALQNNGEYDIVPEYQTKAIDKTLDDLAPVLEFFPSKFLYKSVAGSIRICIVRSVDGEQKSVYHWKGGNPYIVISAGMDVKKAFMEAFAYIVDIHILGNTSRVDSWGSLNPTDFAYGTENAITAYLEGESRAFVDREAMNSVTDDRARTFLAAIEEGNEDLFKTEIMQKKLLLLCRGIRDAWGLKKSTEVFPWEQYLNEPIAYKKK